MGSSSRLGTLALAALCLGSCTDIIVLRDGADGLALTYRCDKVHAQALSTAEREVVRRYGVELQKSDSGLTPDRMSALVAAYDREWGQFEELVARELCDAPHLPRGVSDTPRSRYAFLKPGDPAPDFTLPLLTRDDSERGAPALSLSDFRGRYVILAFWSTWCSPCKDEYPELGELQERLGDRGLTVLGVLHRDSPSNALAFVERQEAGSYPTVVDEDRTVADAYSVRGLPTTVIIGPNGAVVDYMVGWHPDKAPILESVLLPAR